MEKEDDQTVILNQIKNDIIGNNLMFTGPYGEKHVVYSDFIASGKALHSIENYIKDNIQPFYANVHSESSLLAEHSENFRREAKQIIRRYYNTDERDCIIFSGQGSTASVNKLVRLLNLHKKVVFYNEIQMFNSLRVTYDDPSNFIKVNQIKFDSLKSMFKELYDVHNFLFINRWGKYECSVCKETFENESQFNLHEKSESHIINIEKYKEFGNEYKFDFDTNDFIKVIEAYKIFEPIVFLSLMEHNSNALVWRDTGAKIVYIGFKDSEFSLYEFDYSLLEKELDNYKENVVKIGSFIAASNISGEILDVDYLSVLLHKKGALAFFDYATAAPYLKLNMNKPLREIENESLCYKDAVFFSPHKFLGGPNTSGVLILKQSIVRTLLKPADTGGGIVLFVTQTTANYTKSLETREEVGTPDIIAAARIGLTILNKHKLDQEFINKRNYEINQQVLYRLIKIPNLYFIGSGLKKEKIPIYSFIIKFNGKLLHYNFVCALLNDLFGIQSRGGCMCASTFGSFNLNIEQDVLDKLEKTVISGKEIFRPGFTRVNFHYTLNEAEINFILDAIEFCSYFGWMFLPTYKYKIETGAYKHLQKKDDIVWLNNYLDQKNSVSSVLKEFNKNLITYSESPFSNSERKKYMVEAFEKLLGLDQSIKQLLGKSQINHQILFTENSDLRWFLLPDEFYDNQFFYYKIDFYTKKIISTTEDGIEIDMSGINCFLEDSTFRKSIELQLNICFGLNIKMLSFYSVFVNQNKEEFISISKEVLGKEIESDKINSEIIGDLEDDSKKNEKNGLLKIPKAITSLVGEALINFEMLKDGDRVLIGLSGGKDSLSLIHIMLYFQKCAPVKFEIGVITVDPQSADYKPEPLKNYVKSLGLPYFFESDPILERAKESMKNEKDSICAFCSRMKRGVIYTCARREKFNVIALGQHLDDLAESFIMSIFHNGMLRTMKANYTIDAGDLRVIRPLVYCREKLFKEFASEAKLPVIQENCPACFSAPKERLRVKMLLSQQENLFPSLFSSLKKGMIPLMKGLVENGDKKKDDFDLV